MCVRVEVLEYGFFDYYWFLYYRIVCFVKKNFDFGGSLYICFVFIFVSISRVGFKLSKIYFGNLVRSFVNSFEMVLFFWDSRERKILGMKSRCSNFFDCLFNYRKKKKR